MVDPSTNVEEEEAGLKEKKGWFSSQRRPR